MREVRDVRERETVLIISTAPEIISGLVAGNASDMYSLGRVISYMIAHTDTGDPITESGRSPQEVTRMRTDRVLRDSTKSEHLRPLLLPDASLRCSADSYVYWRQEGEDDRARRGGRKRRRGRKRDIIQLIFN